MVWELTKEDLPQKENSMSQRIREGNARDKPRRRKERQEKTIVVEADKELHDNNIRSHCEKGAELGREVLNGAERPMQGKAPDGMKETHKDLLVTRQATISQIMTSYLALSRMR